MHALFKSFTPSIGIQTCIPEGSFFDFGSMESIFEEFRGATTGGVADYTGVSYARLEREEALFWPVPSPEHPGTPPVDPRIRLRRPQPLLVGGVHLRLHRRRAVQPRWRGAAPVKTSTARTRSPRRLTLISATVGL